MGAALKHVDARSHGVRESRTALVRFDDIAVVFTASWPLHPARASQADVADRRWCLVRLFVPPAQRELPFHRATSITLYATDEPLMSETFGGVLARHHDGLTLAWSFVDEPRYAFGTADSEPTTGVSSTLSARAKQSDGT